MFNETIKNGDCNSNINKMPINLLPPSTEEVKQNQDDFHEANIEFIYKFEDFKLRAVNFENEEGLSLDKKSRNKGQHST